LFYGGRVFRVSYRLNLKSARSGLQSLSAPFLFPRFFSGSPEASFVGSDPSFFGRKSDVLRVDYFVITNFFAMKPIFRSASFFFILSLLLVQNAFAQHPVIFETFTVDNDLCNAPTQFQTDMLSVLNSEGDKNYSKMIHLDHHVLEGDPLTCAYSSSVADRLNGVASGSVYLFFGSVDRINLPNGDGANGTKAEFDIGLNGSTYTVNSSWASDMESAISSEGSMTPPDNISLVGATLDKSTNQYTFSATVSVTATTSISDSLIIRYAILEDGVSGPVCNAATTHNDVVRYITTGDSVVFVPGTSSGTVKNVTFTQADLLSANPGEPGAFDDTNLRFVAFLESSGGGNYSVVDAKQLVSNFSTLPAPAPTLTFNEDYISGDTLNPATPANPQPAEIYYTATNLPNGIMVYYSLDDGTTWRYIENSTTEYGPANWTVPDSLTTQGKIKLVAVGDDTLISIEKGTFTIANPPSVTILKPQAAQVIKAGSNDTIVWTNVSITANTLEYYFAEADGDFVTPHVLGTNLTDTFFVWAVPDTTRTVEIKLVPINDEAPAATVVDTIEGAVVPPPNSVASSSAPTGLTITNVFPNPASNGEEIVVQYSEPQPTPVTIQLLDLLGRVMPETYTTDNLAIHLNTGTLDAGAYVVRLSDGTNTVSKRVEIIR
jgi:hypothetical protein